MQQSRSGNCEAIIRNLILKAPSQLHEVLNQVQDVGAGVQDIRAGVQDVGAGVQDVGLWLRALKF
jgi:hypothetical protein